MGFGARQYKPSYRSTGRRGNGWHIVTDARRREYVSYNADFWKEVAQKGWLGTPGAPGSCSLPKGKHQEFADQIVREPLLSKVETPLGTRWEYATLPGPHDMGDVMQMIYLGADALGMGTGGAGVPRRPRTNRRRVRHVRV
jgi:hypothetical protein